MKFLSLVRHTESKTGVPLTRSLWWPHGTRSWMGTRTSDQVLLCVPVKELMRSGKHSERARYPEFIPDFTVVPV